VADDTSKRLDDVRRYSNCDCNEDERSAIMDVRHNEGECQIGFLLSLIDSLLAENEALKKPENRGIGDGDIAALFQERDRLRAEVARKDEALREIARDTACRCDEAYTARGRCEPNAFCYLEDIARAALGEKP
jgi:hypothetical protein